MDYSIGYMPHAEGNYNDSVQYTPMSIVYNGGKSYISKVAVQQVEPGVTSGWGNKWQNFADGTPGAQGAQGSQGITGSNGIDGAQGAQGSTGATGSNGSNGERGAGVFVSDVNTFADNQPITAADLTNPFTPKFIVGDLVMDRAKKWFTVMQTNGTSAKLRFLNMA